jgi:hypothetical protein
MVNIKAEAEKNQSLFGAAPGITWKKEDRMFFREE